MDLSEAVIVKSSRLKSVVWNDFDRFKKGDTCVAVCRHCKKKLSGSSTSGTSHLRNHLIRCQRRTNPNAPQALTAREKKREGALALTNYNFDQDPKRDEALSLVNIKFEHDQARDDVNHTINPGSSSFNQRQSQLDLARMIIIHGYPLSMVDHLLFKVFVKNLQPMFDLVNFATIEADCLLIYEREKQKASEVLDKLPGKISVSVDTWLSGSTDCSIEYLRLTAHYINEDWQLKKKTLNLIIVDPSHTEEVRSDIIMGSLMGWGIDHKSFSMTFDSSPMSDNTASRIRDRLSQNKFLFSNGKLFDVRCAANVLELMAGDAMEGLRDVINKVRGCVRYVKRSVSIQEKFYEIAQQVGIDCQKCLFVDNEMNWNSTCYMLEGVIEYRTAFSILQQHDDHHHDHDLSETEWERVSAVTGFLKFFVEVIHVFSRTKCQTSNIYFSEICALHLQLTDWGKNAQDERVSAIITKMRSRFDNYWEKCRLGLAVAAILDPRFKMKLVEYYFPQIYGDKDSPGRVEEASGCARALYSEHALGSPLACIDPSMTWQVGGEARDRLMGFDRYIHETTQGQGTTSDFDKYLEEPLFPRNVDFSILNWWKVHAPTYPLLSMMARNVLAVPMSRGGFESRVLDRHRSGLNPVTVEALVCTQDWLQTELES